MKADPNLIAARARSVAARQRLNASVETAKARLSPSSIASDAIDGVKAKATDIASGGADAVRQRPATAVAAVAAIALVLARKPIARLFGSGEAPAAPEDARATDATLREETSSEIDRAPSVLNQG